MSTFSRFNQVAVSLALSTFLWASPIVAEDFTVDQCYEKFSRFSPKEVVDFAQRAADDLAKNKEAVFADYNDINKKSWLDHPFSPLITTINCDEMRGVTFPLKEMYSVVTSPHFLQKFTDADGLHTFVKGCAKLKGEAKGTWVLQTHYWPQCNGPLRMGVLLLKIKGTPWAIQASLPNTKYSLQELNQSLK